MNGPKIVVQRCKGFKPVKAKFDVLPGVNPYAVTPGSSEPVSFTMLSKGKFNASLVDAATERMGSAVATCASMSDVQDHLLTATTGPDPLTTSVGCSMNAGWAASGWVE